MRCFRSSRPSLRLADACRLTLAVLAAAWFTMPAPAQAQTAAKAAADTRPTLQRIRDSGVLRLGHRTDALPFAYLDASKRPIGYGVDICNEVIAVLRRDLKLTALRVDYVPVTAANRIALMREGRIDMECGLTVNNAERRAEVSFAMPYYFAGPRILVPVSSPIKDFSDLNNRKVGSAKGANAVPILRDRIDRGVLKGTQLIEFANNNEAFTALARQEVDAFVTTDNLLFAYRATAPKPSDWHVVGNPLVVEPVAIMLRKDDNEFKAAIDRALAGLMLDGVAARLYTRWFLQPVPPSNVVVDIPLSAVLRDQFRWPGDRL